MTRIILQNGFARLLLSAVACLSISTAQAAASGEGAVENASKNGRCAFVLFYQGNDAATRSMQSAIKTTLNGRTDAVLVPVRISDPAEHTLVQKFDATRIPMPATAVIAPNGAVCGVYPQRVTEKQLAASIVSKGQADCLKALQDGKIVLLCAQPAPNAEVPAGVSRFQRDRMFATRTEVVTVQANDPEESRFLGQLRVPKNRSEPVVAFMAPPGVMLGMYGPEVTHASLAETLAAAGKCCDDASCKYNKSASSGGPSRR